MRAYCGSTAPHDGFATGTFVLLNAVSTTMEDRNFAAIEEAAREWREPVERIDPGDIPGLNPLDSARATRALHLPDERYIDARAWLATLDLALAALPGVHLARPRNLRLSPADGGRFRIDLGDHHVIARQLVVAAGVWTEDLVRQVAPDAALVPVLAGEGSAVQVHTEAAGPAPTAVLRTPNRAYACGLHAVPQADGTLYLGATSNPAVHPTSSPSLDSLRNLLECGITQLNLSLTSARVAQLHHGNRPIGIDGYPLLGPTGTPGLWVATGTHREGLHCSPVIAAELAAGLAAEAEGAAGADLFTSADRPLTARFAPERALICEWTREEAVTEAAVHHHAVAVEAGMRPALMGRWPDRLREMYARHLRDTYAALPDGFVLPPHFAPAAYESGEELRKILEAHLQR
ncbi:NAD(P)/FAD-dependent oxidoreductase [Streptomyces roseochromogenus]|uniref:FAD dependent oxidoreductase domain-containing protein n=1 Tax=Streptomyces roseochromogenus subsp. oscitans DS 12.976 TaxID=1352936 RepID=V6JYN5_STRRC|nr:FAD-dependent oxidoreductase [Streptomyces roseochromogenus]EST24231.1 hypothetical protein M878_31615 [Streptomyces roseochromogenus subsp. oscitans DS 12.976]